MRPTHFAVAALTATFALAGCNAGLSPQPPQDLAAHSSMLPEAKSEDLLYVSDYLKNVAYVFSFPTGKRVGTLTGLNSPWGECTDSAGNIWITNLYAPALREYAHGGSAPIATLDDPIGAEGCSVDSASGDLAVIAEDPAEVAIYSHAQGTPQLYSDPLVVGFVSSTYDAGGNLFVTTTNPLYPLAELAKGAASFVTIAYPKTVYLDSVLWDGTNLVAEELWGVDGPATFDRIAVEGATARIIGTIKLYGRHGKKKNAGGGEFVLYNGEIVGPNHSPTGGDRFVDSWPYPQGGAAFNQILVRNAEIPDGMTISRH